MAGRQRRSTGKMSSSFYLFWTRIKRRKKAAHEVHLLAHFNTATNKKCLHWQQIIGRIDAHVAITPEESPAIVTGLLDFFHNQGKKTHISWRFLNEKSSQEKWQITYRSNDKPRPKRGSCCPVSGLNATPKTICISVLPLEATIRQDRNGAGESNSFQ